MGNRLIDRLKAKSRKFIALLKQPFAFNRHDQATWHYDQTLRDLLASAASLQTRAERNLWLIHLIEWLRYTPLQQANLDEPQNLHTPIARIQHILDFLDSEPQLKPNIAGLFYAAMNELDSHSLWVDFGFAPSSSFLSELGERLRLTYLPATPDTSNLGELFGLLFRKPDDAKWVRAIDKLTFERIQAVLQFADSEDTGSKKPHKAPSLRWQQTIADSIGLLASQIHASAYSATLRERMDHSATQQPFHKLIASASQLTECVERQEQQVLMQHVTYLRALLDQCSRTLETVYDHLDEYGISVEVVFQIDQQRERILRIDSLLNVLSLQNLSRELLVLLSHLIEVAHQRKNIGFLFSKHYSLLARKLVQRSAEVGAHYITASPREYLQMFGKASIGGALIAFTTFIKFFIGSLSLALFWNGFWAGLNYAISFLAIYLLHGVIATKQPAMTAPAMAARLRNLDQENKTEEFVDEVTKLIRSQFAGIAGNVFTVAPVVILIQTLTWLCIERNLIDLRQANYALHANTLLGPSPLFAALTGGILFLGSLIAGWTENWFVWHKIDSAMTWHPRFVAWLGRKRAQRWGEWWRENISGVTSNIALGFLLGMVPALAQFIGIPLEVRHVSLATGQIAAAAGAYGWNIINKPEFWWCIAAIPVIGCLNLLVSFFLAFRLALRSSGIRITERTQLYRALAYRFYRAPLSFFFPPRFRDEPTPYSGEEKTSSS